MSVSGIGSSTSASQLFATSTVSGSQSTFDPQDTKRTDQTPFRSDFASMLSAVQSGDMTQAQSALAAVQSDMSSTNATYSPQSTPGSGGLPTDLQNLFDAVQKGDAPDAQQALAQLQTDAQQKAQTSGAQGHHHHHHHQAPSSPSDATNPSSTTDPLTLTADPSDVSAE